MRDSQGSTLLLVCAIEKKVNSRFAPLLALANSMPTLLSFGESFYCVFDDFELSLEMVMSLSQICKIVEKRLMQTVLFIQKEFNLHQNRSDRCT